MDMDKPFSGKYLKGFSGVRAQYSTVPPAKLVVYYYATHAAIWCGIIAKRAHLYLTRPIIENDILWGVTMARRTI